MLLTNFQKNHANLGTFFESDTIFFEKNFFVTGNRLFAIKKLYFRSLINKVCLIGVLLL